jgi:copper chaperone CopZ
MEGTTIFQRREVAVVNAVSAYLHALDGRLRIKVPSVKGSSKMAQEIERQLQACEGITQVTANPVTGSVLILYEPQQIKQKEILDIFKSQGCLPENSPARAVAKNEAAAQPGFSQELVQTLVRSTMEFALQRLIYMLI